MFAGVKRLYEKTGSAVIVGNAVLKGWITAGEYREITGEEYAA